MTDTDRSAQLTGWLLVAIQGLLFAGIAFWPASWSPTVQPMLWPSIAVVVVGAVGLVLSGMHLGQALTPHPEPNGAGLAARGIYRWMRHPMYTALVVICAGVALGRGVVVVWLLVALLAVFFEVKSRVEERYLLRTYEGYDAYAAQTGKFLPGLGKRA